ncbi:MAG: ribosome assembly factor SBDS [Candidatus Aenigmarchaeota archaeon]|nr:ribosome assembly factor SBDS [Candidatus Aenigmarchaeota archaeon]
MSVSVEKSVIARITKFGNKFEILVDPEKALEVRSGKEMPEEDWLATTEIYEDSHKGERASEEDLKKSFGTTNVSEIAKKIITHGDIQLTTEQRRKMIENKRKLVATLIAREGSDPKTGHPHPVERIMNAMEEVNIKIELGKKADEQIENVVKEIQRVLPIKFEKIEISIKVGAKFGGKVASVVRNVGRVKKEEWQGDGSYYCVIEISAGLQDELYDKINGITHGENETKLLN